MKKDTGIRVNVQETNDSWEITVFWPHQEFTIGMASAMVQACLDAYAERDKEDPDNYYIRGDA